MENGSSHVDSGSATSSSKPIIATLWVITIAVAVFFGFMFGKGSSSSQNQNLNTSEKNVLGSASNQEQPANQVNEISDQTPTPPIATPTVTGRACAKSGFAQKWEYLTPYVVKEGDSLQNIVTSELGDSTRLDEVLALNGVGPLVVGSTVYLPPKSITKSNGKIKLLYGKLVLKNASSWQLSFNDDTNGQGILIPTFWFADIKDRDVYKVGDCLSILVYDGFKVFSVARQ